MVTIRIESVEQLAEVVSVVLKKLFILPFTRAHVIALHGDLGVGKTTFVQQLAIALGVNGVVTSPTFVIMKGYETEKAHYEHLVHVDAYRIDDPKEMQLLRFSELVSQPNTLVCVEWAERIRTLLPRETLHVRIAIIDESRVITIEQDE